MWASQVTLGVKDLLANAGNVRDAGSVPGTRRSPRGGHGNPLQCSCLENPMKRGAWQATVHRTAKSWARLKQHSTHTCGCYKTTVSSQESTVEEERVPSPELHRKQGPPEP